MQQGGKKQQSLYHGTGLATVARINYLACEQVPKKRERQLSFLPFDLVYKSFQFFPLLHPWSHFSPANNKQEDQIAIWKKYHPEK